MSGIENINKKQDMASAIDTLRTFSGEDSVTINQWLDEATMIADLTELSEKDTIKLFLLRMRKSTTMELRFLPIT